MRFSICFPAAGLMAALSLISCNRNGSAGAEVDSTLKGFILPGTKALAYVDLQQIKRSDFFKRHQGQFSLSQLEELPAQIGMDPRKDLSASLITWDGKSALVMAHGTFDPAQVEKRLNGSAMPYLKYHNLTFHGDGKRDIVLFPRGIAMAGEPELLKKAADESATGGGGLSEDLQLQMARVNKGAQIWVVTSGVIPIGDFSIRNDAATTISNISDYINATAIGLTFTSGAKLEGHLSCISEEGSQRVHDALRGIIGLARLSTRDDQLDQLKIWDSIHVERQGKDVQVNAELTPELADKMMTLGAGMAKRF